MNSSRARDIIIIGAGGVATSMALALRSAGHRIVQVYSRTGESARRLAERVEAEAVTSVDEIRRDAELCVVSLTDSALVELAPQLVEGRASMLFAHTAGSIAMDVLPTSRRGVFYPMQTFSRSRVVDFSNVPLFIEASQPDDLQLLKDVAESISPKVVPLSSEGRQYLHVAAVFCSNFVNHCYAQAASLLAERGVDFDVMLPLIDEVARKVHSVPPRQAQTGPAVRRDFDVVRRQTEMLPEGSYARAIYELMSQSIIRCSDDLKNE